MLSVNQVSQAQVAQQDKPANEDSQARTDYQVFRVNEVYQDHPDWQVPQAFQVLADRKVTLDSAVYQAKKVKLAQRV